MNTIELLSSVESNAYFFGMTSHTNTVSLSTHLDPFLESKWIKGLISLSVGNQKPLPTVSQNCKFTESYHVHLCSMFAHALMEVGVQQSTRRRLLRHVSLGFWRLRAGRNDTNILLGSDCNVKMSRCQVTMTMGLQVACLLRRRTRAKLYTVELSCSLEKHGKQ